MMFDLAMFEDAAYCLRKYAGITGGWDAVRRQHRPPAEGESMSSTKITGTYKLP
jgi:hypothetical protein